MDGLTYNRRKQELLELNCDDDDDVVVIVCQETC
jgi:hypothetical protein